MSLGVTISIVNALIVAKRALRAQQHPPESDLADIDLILKTKYPNLSRDLTTIENFAIAYRMGFRSDRYDEVNVNEWLRRQQTEGRVVHLGQGIDGDHE